MEGRVLGAVDPKADVGVESGVTAADVGEGVGKAGVGGAEGGEGGEVTGGGGVPAKPGHTRQQMGHAWRKEAAKRWVQVGA